MATKKATKFDGNKRRQFLTWLTKLGYIGPAAAKCGVARSTIYEHRDSDPTFRRAMELAVEDHNDAMAVEYQDQAVNGVPVERETIVKGKLRKLKGRRFYPYLLARYVERRHPDFKPAVDINFPEGGGVLAVTGHLPVDEFFEKHGHPDPGPDPDPGAHTTPMKRGG